MSNVDEARALPALAYHIQRVRTKIASGIYKTEPVKCFCGQDDGIQVTDQDRYGIEYLMFLCKNCGILYANPRLTEDSLSEFYSCEYRPIYDFDQDKEEQFDCAVTQGENIIKFLEYFDFHPKSVLDIGCNMGGNLIPFLEIGCRVKGIEFGPGIETAKQYNVPLHSGSLYDLNEMFDLVIMNHVFEHLTDLERVLDKVKDILTDEGRLIIRVPGLFAWEKDILFQNAHNWQFTRNSLAYVMECCGYEEIYCDEHIVSMWKYTGKERSKKATNKQAVVDNHAYLFKDKKRLPEVNGYNKFPVKVRMDGIEHWLSLDIPDIHDIKESVKGGDALIVGGGPSVNDYFDEILQMQSNGAKVFAIERMYKGCLDKGVTPDYVVVFDASDDILESMGSPMPEVTHLISTQCKKELSELVRNYPCYLFNTPQKGIDMERLWDKYKRPTTTIINGGGSVTLCAMSCALTIGFSDVHIFGFDCHIGNGSYANGITGFGAIQDSIQVEVDGKFYTTTPPYMSFAQQFFKLKKWAEDGGLLKSVKIYGDSIVSEMSKENISDNRRVDHV